MGGPWGSLRVVFRGPRLMLNCACWGDHLLLAYGRPSRTAFCFDIAFLPYAPSTELLVLVLQDLFEFPPLRPGGARDLRASWKKAAWCAGRGGRGAPPRSKKEAPMGACALFRFSLITGGSNCAQET